MLWRKSKKVKDLWLGVNSETKEETGQKIRFLSVPNAYMAVQKDLMPIGTFMTLSGAIGAFGDE